MKPTRFLTAKTADFARLQPLLNSNSQHPHIHLVDMPYRLTATWQDFSGDLGLWEQDDELVAWGVFQPAWWNFDYVMRPALRGGGLEKELLAWGIQQMQAYAMLAEESFWGSVEFFADDPYLEQTLPYLTDLGFQKFDWTTVRLARDLQQALPSLELPLGFAVRPLRGADEVEAYVKLHQAAFGSEKMTSAWRKRTLAHPAYRPALDLVVVNASDEPVGFCICWLGQDKGHLEPLGIHPEYQGQGLGQAIEAAALHTLRQYGVRWALIDHTSFNEKAIALSEANGFRKVNEAVRYYVDVGP